MPSLEALITLASAGWDPAVEREIFGTADPPHIARVIEAFVSCRCGPVDDAIFYKPGVGIVAGLRLVGGSDVVVKIHRWNVSVDRLIAVQEVQAYAADGGMPAPDPSWVPRRSLVESQPLKSYGAAAERMEETLPFDDRSPRVCTPS